ncbi:MAG: hypothetical protein CMC67_07605 [Flavobacteriaceae bacterium]|jgi:uncharacterized alpha-E superfamily protein|nr:hypothetical protein [Flavobacteriaceae bacterium]|tara:strand:+ start:2392 stop:3327 length:936 start_codon:yes stop_codon:yes gene_type:complete
MLSRVANNLFWMDRYMERSYGLLNLIKTNYSSTLDSGDYSSWNNITQTYLGYESRTPVINHRDSLKIIFSMLFDKNNSNSILNMIFKSRENARSVQEHISRELWLSVNKFFLHLSQENIKGKYRKSDPITIVNELLQYNHIYYSVADITQERGNAYCFMNLGKYLERVVQSIDFLNVRIISFDEKSENIYESYFFKNLLTSIGGYQIYLKTFKSLFKIENIIEMIAVNESFPRSIIYSINKLFNHVERLNNFNNINDKRLIFIVGKLKNNLKYTTIQTIKSQGLTKFLDETKTELNKISNTINNTYFYQSY